MPSKAEMETVAPVVAAEAVSCVELLDRGVGCAMGVAAARLFAEPVPPSMDMAETEAKTVSAAGEMGPRPGTAFGGGDGGRNMSDGSRRGSRKAVNPYTCGSCVRKS